MSLKVNNLMKHSRCFGLDVFIMKQLACKLSITSEKTKKKKMHSKEGVTFSL